MLKGRNKWLAALIAAALAALEVANPMLVPVAGAVLDTILPDGVEQNQGELPAE